MGRFLGFEGVDAVVFDCDGVLVDSEPLSESAWRQTLAEYGVELGEDFGGWVGTTDMALASHYATQAGAVADDLLDRCAIHLSARLETGQLPVFEDSLKAVDRAVNAGLMVAVASNSERWRLDAILAAADLTDRFSVAVTSDDVGQPKPAPDMYLEVARSLGAEPSRCLVIEDSPTGVAAARAAGMRVVAIDRGAFPAIDLAPATKVVEGLDDEP